MEWCEEVEENGRRGGRDKLQLLQECQTHLFRGTGLDQEMKGKSEDTKIEAQLTSEIVAISCHSGESGEW